jgi:hypothetical protein
VKQLRWAFFHLRLWAFELELWLDGLSWEQVRIVAERSKDSVRAIYQSENKLWRSKLLVRYLGMVLHSCETGPCRFSFISSRMHRSGRSSRRDLRFHNAADKTFRPFNEGQMVG